MKRSETTKEYAVLSGDRRGANITGVQKDSGVIALEAAMSLPIFLFLMLALYSMTLLFTAQSLIGHTLTQSAQSLSLETYSTDNLGENWGSSGLITADLKQLLSLTGFNTDFVSDSRWYGNKSTVERMCQSRFCSYLSGSEEEADAVLKALGVVDGVNGLDFSDTSLDGRDLTIVVRYKIKLLFGIRAFQMDLFDFDAAQSVCSRLWGDPEL